MTTHELKCWPGFFGAISEGRKTFELRRHDRDYQEGDILLLREWREYQQEYTGKSIRCEVTYILRGPVFALPQGWVCMSIRFLETQ